MEEQHRSLSEVAGLMGVSERTVRRWIKSGKLRAYKPGRDYRIPESAVRELVEGSEISPKALAPPSLFNGLEEERRADWDAAVRSARQLREHGQARLEELLASWRESNDRGEAPAERRPYLDEIGELLDKAYDAEMALKSALTDRLDLVDLDEFAELQAADRFYVELFKLVQRAGLRIRTDGAQEGEAAHAGLPTAHAVEESKAA